jgi:ABC-2 type transport system ATP-binding protein
MDAIEVRDLIKTYGVIKALRGLSFTVDQGEVFGLIGPNGAGKTTALRVFSTLIRPTSGSVRIFGLDVVREAVGVRRMISYLPEEAGAYRNLTGREYLDFMANFYASQGSSQMLVNEAAKITGLGERLGDRVKTYSKGMSRRLLIARALMMKPRLCILDEPTSGLDVIHAVHVRQTIQNYAETHGVTILLSSHNMLEVELLCNRVALMNQGRILAQGSPAEICAKYNAHNLEEAFLEAMHRG